MRPSHQFDKIAILKPAEYSDGMLSNTYAPGTIFLLDDAGANGGVIRITNTGYLMTLTQAEIFSEQPFQWPEAKHVVVIKRGMLMPHRA